MELNGRLPAHALHHGAGSPDGRNWRVVDVWETPENFERFAAEKIGPITARHGIGEPRITSFPVDEIRRSDPEPVTFLHVVRLRGIDAAGFAAIDKKIGPEPAEGLIFHVNGPLDDGWATVGFWTSKAARDRFIQERIMPAMAGAGEPPTIEDLELHNALTEAAVGTAAQASRATAGADADRGDRLPASTAPGRSARSGGAQGEETFRRAARCA